MMDVLQLILVLFQLTLSTYRAVDANSIRLPDTNITTGHELRKHLLHHYDKVVIPATSKKPVQIKMNIAFNSVELSYDESYMIIHAWLKVEWNDDRLTWDADKYEHINTIFAEYHEIWHPDFIAYNNIGPNAAMNGNTKILINSTGNVLWVPPIQYKIHCRPDMTRWPYDTQTGLLKVGSWVYSDNDLHLINTTHEIEVVSSDPEWHIIHVSSEKISKLYSCCPNEPYSHVEYNITVNRKTGRHHPVVILPTLAVASLNLLVFWLSPDDKCKLITSLFDALIVIVILLVIYSKIPLILSSVPSIVLYYTYSLGLLVLTAIIAVVVKNLTVTSRPLSSLVKIFDQSRFVEFLGMAIKDPASSDDQTQYENKEIYLQNIEFNKKQLLVRIIDKICFVIFIIIYVILLFCLVF